MRAAILVVVSTTLCAVLAVSCTSIGGGPHAQAPRASDPYVTPGVDESGVIGASLGEVVVTITWPERDSEAQARIVPMASNSIRIRAVDTASGEDVGTSPLVLTRPAPEEPLTSSGSIRELPLGRVQFTVTAHGDDSGELMPVQASASTTREIGEGSNADLALTMESTITEVTVTPDTVQLIPGSTATLEATALNSSGEVVLTSNTWSWWSSDPSVANVSDTNSATCMLTGVEGGHCTTTAHEYESGSSGTMSVRVLGPPTTSDSQVVFWNATDLQFQVSENEPGATPGNLDLGGIYFLMGAQRHGSLVFVTQAGYTDPQIRNLATGVSTEFAPAAFSMWAGGLGFKLADISTDGQSVVWIRVSGNNRQIVRSDVDGSNEVVLVSSAVPGLMPARVAISPDGSEVGYITSTGLVRRISMASGASVLLNLNGSTGATAIDWRDNENLVVGCNNALGTGKPGLITVPRDVSPASILFNDGGAGLRSVPANVATDPDGNILFDELDVGLTQREIYRVDPPGFAARIGIVTRAQNDYGVWSLVF